MSGAKIEMTFRNAGLRQDLIDQIERLDDRTDFFKDMGNHLAPVVRERFNTKKDPDGDEWAALSPVTIALREERKPGAPISILSFEGHLAGNIVYQTSQTALSIGTDSTVEHYAAIHQFGGEAGRNRKVTIPARPYLGFGDDDMELIEEEAANFFFPQAL